MGIIRLTLFTVGAMGAAMMHFGRDNDMPADRIGREPTIAQETIVPVSAAIAADIAVSPESAGGEIIATANSAPDSAESQAGFAATPVSLASVVAPQTPAEKAEAAARLMAAGTATTAPVTAALSNATLDQQVAFVSGTTVNMRAGPSTGHGVVAKLTRGTEVIDMGSVGSGWSQIKVVDTGVRGFMASKFLTPQL